MQRRTFFEAIAGLCGLLLPLPAKAQQKKKRGVITVEFHDVEYIVTNGLYHKSYTVPATRVPDGLPPKSKNMPFHKPFCIDKQNLWKRKLPHQNYDQDIYTVYEDGSPIGEMSIHYRKWGGCLVLSRTDTDRVTFSSCFGIEVTSDKEREFNDIQYKDCKSHKPAVIKKLAREMVELAIEKVESVVKKYAEYQK